MMRWSQQTIFTVRVMMGWSQQTIFTVRVMMGWSQRTIITVRDMMRWSQQTIITDNNDEMESTNNNYSSHHDSNCNIFVDSISS
jgi:glutamyl/glutaminyl-tRNA synthetase